MFKRLRIIGLAIAISIIVASKAMADLKFYGGDIRADMATSPTQKMVVDKNLARATQGLTPGDRIAIASTPMYGVVGRNQVLFIVGPAFVALEDVLTQTMGQRQVTASNSNNDTYYKAVGIQMARQNIQMGMTHGPVISGNNGNVQFESRGANPSITFNALEQSTIDQAPSSGPRMLQKSNMIATVTSPGESDTTPFSMVSTGDALGWIDASGYVKTFTGQHQEFDSILANSHGLYNGIIGHMITTETGAVQVIRIGSAEIAYHYHNGKSYVEIAKPFGK